MNMNCSSVCIQNNYQKKIHFDCRLQLYFGIRNFHIEDVISIIIVAMQYFQFHVFDGVLSTHTHTKTELNVYPQSTLQ